MTTDHRRHSPVPTPPHPKRRRQPLPGHQPKPAVEDPKARRRVRILLASPSYRSGDEDTEFLQRNDMRGLRLQADYLKPELLLEQNDVRATIVVFGSTRIPEPRTARR